MGYATEITEWPEIDIPKSVKVLIDKVFSTLDNNDSSAGDTLADEICEPDCEIVFVGMTFKGTEQIRRSRDNAWNLIKTRRHTIQKLYVSNARADDILAFGSAQMELVNGAQVTIGFTCRMKIRDRGDEAVGLTYYTAWADSGPVAKAIAMKPGA